MTMVVLKDRIKNKSVKFVHYVHGELWYVCEDGFEFPVPIDYAGTGCFKRDDKAILFMRYIRKHMEFLDKAKSEAMVESSVRN